MKQFLLDILQSRATPEAMAWLGKAMEAATPPVHDNTLLGFYAGASRRMGKKALMLAEEEQERLRTLDRELVLDRWGIDEAARAVLLLHLEQHVEGDEFASRAYECYEKGDSREQESWLRGLSLLPAPERFLDTVVDACRTNIIPLFESIACENPFPARVFPEPNFNQVVLKALFNDIAMERIVGMVERLNPELSRMCDDYVSEREAAGRPVPSDIWLPLVPHIAPDHLPRVLGYLSHENADHRYWAAVGLGHSRQQVSLSALQAQRDIEQDGRVRSAIKKSLANLG